MLSFNLLAVTGWLIFNSLELVAPTQQTAIISAKFTYLFVAISPVFWVGFALHYTGKHRWLSFPRFAFFWFIPLLTFILVQTNETHRLVWATSKLVSVNPHLHIFRVSYGSWFWVHAAYSYLMVFTGALIIGIQYFRADTLYRAQSRWLILGAITPLIFNFVYIFRLIPTLKKDFSPLAFAFAGIAFAIGIFRYRLFEIMPIARNTVVENMQEGMIVLSNKGQIIDINPAASLLLLCSDQEIIGTLLEKAIPEAAPLFPKDNQQSRIREFSLNRDQKKRNFEGKLSPLFDQKGKLIGHLLILQDITERKKLHQKVEKLAATDALTNLHNRRYFLELAQKELARARRYLHPITLMIIDIDYFKSINDTHGHLAGDQVLIQFSRFLKETLRTADIIGRYGGDEFVVVLPETSQETAKITAIRLCQLFKNTKPCIKESKIQLTLSIGISSEIDIKNSTDIYSLLDRADRALYLAKTRGRDQVVLEE